MDLRLIRGLPLLVHLCYTKPSSLIFVATVITEGRCLMVQGVWPSIAVVPGTLCEIEEPSPFLKLQEAQIGSKAKCSGLFRV